ncbi:hypothetical protein LR48_Vigan01g247700 [Vigna angularis]|uniref:Tf2-1-like SH3-like domain-containing protein n=1 Tax=Phaseolus angularis TaxID=3914 RepID=A0A0L9TQZ5_PHAAN|nr:hypothetical protein LR48_Vigan01g247700 [Vigna angularis]
MVISYQGSAKCIPFEVADGRPPPTLTRFMSGEITVEAVAHVLQKGDEALKQLKYHLGRAQDQMTKYANWKRKPVTIKVEDWIYLKIRPLRQVSMLTTLHLKLCSRYYGSFKVVKQVGPVAFKLQLPDPARILPVFHVS